MLENIAVALVEPEYEVNLGHVARIMKNFGLRRLILVDPKADVQKATKYAAHAQDILKELQISRFDEIAREFDLLVGTTAIKARRRANIARNSITPEELRRVLQEFGESICLVFGRDTTGLNKEEISECDIIVTIPTGTDYATLNISHAAAIILYELSKTRIKVGEETALRKDRQRVIEYSMKLAETSGYPQYRRRLLKEALKQILGRSRARPREVSLLTGLLRRANMALEKQVRYA